MSELLQVWVRNEKGQVYGPLTPPSIELLIDNNVIAGRMQISTDGMNYVYPGRVPGLRMIFPREIWGDIITPGEQLDAEWTRVVMPASIHGQDAAASAAPAPAAAPSGGPVGAPVAGPGVRAGPIAGPGTRLQQPGRPANPGAQGRAGASAPSGIRSSPSVAEFMNAGSPSAPRSSSPSGMQPAPRTSPSVADFMNAATPAAPSRPVVAPASAPSAPRPPVTSSSSGVRSVPPASPAGDLQIPSAGVLGQVSTQQLYYFAAVSEATGLLTVKLADRELVAHFKKGNPEYLDSTHAEDSLETFLLAQKLATKAQIDQAQAGSARFGGELLGALFGLGLLNPNAVFQHLGQRAGQLLQRVLTAEQGSFSFNYEELPASRSMPMGNKWAVYLESLRRVPVSDLRRRLMSALELPVMKGGGRVAATDLRLTPQETRALNYFDGVRSLSQLLKDVPAEGDTVLRTAWMLAPLELVSFAGVSTSGPRSSAPPPPKPVAAAPPPPVMAPKAAAPVVTPAKPSTPPVPVAAPAKVPSPPVSAPAASKVPEPPVMAPAAAVRPATAPGNPVQVPRPVAAAYPGAPVAGAPQRPLPPVMKPAASGPTPAASDAETKQLQTTHEQMKKQNFFEILGLKREADAGAVKMAYLKAARSYHPDTVPPGSSELFAKLKADVFALISEANRTLSDPVLRQEYTAELDAGGTGSKVDMEKIFRGEEVFQKGRILVQARKYPDAVKMFEEAVTCNPDEPEFYAWRGYAKHLQATDKKSVERDVLKDINFCVAKNPNVASAYYFLGFVAKAHGDDKTAMANFKKCVALDPKHIDAQREVRSAKK